MLAQAGTGWAQQVQPGRESLDALGRLLLLLGPALLVLRHRHPVAVLYGTCAVTLAHLAGGYPYGPVVVSVAVACLAAIGAGHRHAAWAVVGALWAGHLLIAHWPYRVLSPPGDGPLRWGAEGGVTAWVIAVRAPWRGSPRTGRPALQRGPVGRCPDGDGLQGRYTRRWETSYDMAETAGSGAGW